VTQMRIATLAAYFGAAHAVAEIVEQANVLLLLGMGETGPATVRFEFRVGREEWRAARPADVLPVVADAEETARKRRFRAGLPKDVISLGAQLLAPLLFGFGYGRRVVVLTFHMAHNAAAAVPDAAVAGRYVAEPTWNNGGMKLLLEILLSLILHPIAMVLMWISLLTRGDMTALVKIVWFVVSIVWGLGPILYVLVAEGSLW
jgi:hypothetical protein